MKVNSSLLPAHRDYSDGFSRAIRDGSDGSVASVALGGENGMVIGDAIYPAVGVHRERNPVQTLLTSAASDHTQNESKFISET